MAVKKFGNGGVVGAVVVDGYDDVSDGDGDQGSLVRGATAIESDGLMAKDRTALTRWAFNGFGVENMSPILFLHYSSYSTSSSSLPPPSY